MKLYELVEKLYLEHGNERAKLNVITPAVAVRYGSDYEGRRVCFCGVSGRLGDIPAYLGGCEVIDYFRETYFRHGETVETHIITI